MNSKERAFLRSKANTIEPVCSVGKEGITPEFISSIDEALKTRELIKVNIQKNCDGDKREIAEIISERTNSRIVQIMGRKITLYKRNKKNQYGI